MYNVSFVAKCMPGIPEIPGHMGTLAAQIGCGRANCGDRALGRMTRPSALRGADGRIGRSVEYNRVPAGCACGIYARPAGGRLRGCRSLVAGFPAGR